MAFLKGLDYSILFKGFKCPFCLVFAWPRKSIIVLLSLTKHQSSLSPLLHPPLLVNITYIFTNLWTLLSQNLTIQAHPLLTKPRGLMFIFILYNNGFLTRCKKILRVLLSMFLILTSKFVLCVFFTMCLTYR